MADALGALRPGEEKMFEGQPRGFPLGDFDIEDVMLPEGDDLGVPSDDDSVPDEKIETETGFGSVIVVDNLPRVPPEKLEKLMGVVDRIFGQVGTVREGGVFMPRDEETGLTQGFAFVEYNTTQEAQAAQQQTNGYKLDKNHVFAVSMFDDFERYARVPEEYAPAEAQAYEPRENLREWAVDRRGRDQYLVKAADETEVWWNDAQRSMPESAYKRENWTDLFAAWSPRGSFVATLHRQGVALWGGASFARLQRFSHANVTHLQFSPEERYLVTLSSVEPTNPRDKTTFITNVFNVKSGARLRNFQLTPEDVFLHPADNLATAWPFFKWAGGCNDKYFARLGRNAVSVYEAPDCMLLDKRSIKLENVQAFQWSPAAPILSACQSEQASGNLPARVVLLKIPERTELRQKNLFTVKDVAMYWHPQGDYLAVQVDRYTKTRKSTYTSFELFGLKERDIPMEVLELPNKADKVTDFAWEPRGSRFAMLHGDGPRPSFSLYGMRDMSTAAKVVQHLGTQPGKQALSIHWSPQGKYLVLAGLKGMNGQLEFVGADDMEVLSAAEHFLATELAWDPTGRYVATAVFAMQGMENGVNMWLFNGQLIYRLPREKLLQFMWRPRPASQLTRAQEEAVFRSLKKYSKRYDEEDAQILHAADTEIIAERARLQEEWARWYESKRQWLDWQAEGRAELLGARGQEGEFSVQDVEAEVPMGPPQEEVLKG